MTALHMAQMAIEPRWLAAWSRGAGVPGDDEGYLVHAALRAEDHAVGFVRPERLERLRIAFELRGDGFLELGAECRELCFQLCLLHVHLRV